MTQSEVLKVSDQLDATERLCLRNVIVKEIIYELVNKNLFVFKRV